MADPIMDKVSAWAELERFADAAGVALDERGHPDEDPLDDPDTESDVEDYPALIKAIRYGRIEIDDNGKLTVCWRRGPAEGSLVLDPAKWRYAMALRAMSKTRVQGKRGKNKSPETEDNLKKLFVFLGCLGDKTEEYFWSLDDKLDAELALRLAGLIAQG